MFSRNRVEPAGPAVVIRDGSLRQRGGGGAHVEIEESLLQPDQDAPVRGDSMSLFATLVPPPLRKSKKNFTSGKRVFFFFPLILSFVGVSVHVVCTMVWFYGHEPRTCTKHHSRHCTLCVTAKTYA